MTSLARDPLEDPLISLPPPTAEPDALRQALMDAYDLAGTLLPLGGERDRNFRLDTPAGESLLVKLSHPAEDNAITDFQTRALLHLEAADPSLPVPRMRRTRAGATSLGFAVVGGISQLRVLSFVPGVPIAAIASGRDLGAFVAALDRALDGFTHPAQTRRLLWDIREVDCCRRLLPMVEDTDRRALAATAIARFEREVLPLLPDLPRQVIHNDLNPHNILVDPARPERITGIIDFGDMLAAPRIQEVATAAAYMLAPGLAPLDTVAEFVAGYHAVLPLSETERGLLPALIGMRNALTVCITGWRARAQPENAAYINRNAGRAVDGLRTLAALDPAATARALGLEEV